MDYKRIYAISLCMDLAGIDLGELNLRDLTKRTVKHPQRT